MVAVNLQTILRPYNCLRDRHGFLLSPRGKSGEGSAAAAVRLILSPTTAVLRDNAWLAPTPSLRDHRRRERPFRRLSIPQLDHSIRWTVPQRRTQSDSWQLITSLFVGRRTKSRRRATLKSLLRESTDGGRSAEDIGRFSEIPRADRNRRE